MSHPFSVPATLCGIPLTIDPAMPENSIRLSLASAMIVHACLGDRYLEPTPKGILSPETMTHPDPTLDEPKPYAIRMTYKTGQVVYLNEHIGDTRVIAGFPTTAMAESMRRWLLPSIPGAKQKNPRVEVVRHPEYQAAV